MFSNLNFDELNQLHSGKRAESYETYFAPMELSEEAKRKRIKLAQRLEDKFFLILAYLFTLQQYQSAIDWERIQEQFESGYLDAIKGIVEKDEYIKSYAGKLASDLTDSTREHEEDSYYYSLDRSMWVAENEANVSLNHQEFTEAIKSGKTKKKWIDIRDNRERATHRKVGGTVKKITEPFLVGDSLMMFPKDVSFGASADQYVNCRCTAQYY